MSAASWTASALLAGTVVLAVGGGCTLVLRKHAAWQNAVARTVLLLLLVLPGALALAARMPGPRWEPARWLSQAVDHWDAERPLPILRQPGSASPTPASTVHKSTASSRTPAPASSVSLRDSLLGVWSVGAVVSFGGLLIGLARVRRLVRVARPLLSSESRTLLTRCTRTAGVVRPTLQAVPGLASPLLVGWWHPRILVPEEGGLPSREVLLHELAHLRRRDLWWTTLGRVAVALWWFHPLAWGLTRRLERSAEDVCDDLVVWWTEDAPGYASQLVGFARAARSRPPFALAGVAITGFRSGLGQRVARLLEPERKLRVSIGTGGTALLATGAVAMLGLFLAAAPSQGEAMAGNGQTVGEVHFSLNGDWDDKDQRKEVPAPAEIVAISGLCPGAKYDERQAQEAARRLLATGRYEYARVYSQSAPGAAMDIKIVCTPKFASGGTAGASDRGDAVPSVAASVNGVPILNRSVRDLFGPRERNLRTVFTGEELNKQLGDGRRKALDDLIDRELLIQEFARREYVIPEDMVDERIATIVREDFNGDHAAFITTLNKQNYTEERFRQAERDKIVVQAMRYSATRDIIEREKKEHRSFPEERSRQQEAFVKDLRAKADIQIMPTS